MGLEHCKEIKGYLSSLFPAQFMPQRDMRDISSANGNTTKQSTIFYYKVIPVYKLAYKATDTTILLQKKVNKGNDSEMHEIIPLHRSNVIGINASSGD